MDYHTLYTHSLYPPPYSFYSRTTAAVDLATPRLLHDLHYTRPNYTRPITHSSLLPTRRAGGGGGVGLPYSRAAGK